MVIDLGKNQVGRALMARECKFEGRLEELMTDEFKFESEDVCRFQIGYSILNAHQCLFDGVRDEPWSR